MQQTRNHIQTDIENLKQIMYRVETFIHSL